MSVRVNFPFSGGGWRESEGRAQDRAARFRKGRKPGDTIRGVFVRSGPPGHGWVEVDGHLLLARLDAEAFEGQVLLFVIERLEPDIMLRLLDGGGTPAPAPATLLAHYIEARDKLDALLRINLWSLPPAVEGTGATTVGHVNTFVDSAAASPPPPEADVPNDGGLTSATNSTAATSPIHPDWANHPSATRLACLAALIGSTMQVARAYVAYQQARLALLPLLRERGVFWLQHMPWLHPAAQGLDVAIASGSGRMQTVFAGATLPGAGPCLVEMLWLPPQLGCHVRGPLPLSHSRPDTVAPAVAVPTYPHDGGARHVAPPLPDLAGNTLCGQPYGNAIARRHGSRLRPTPYGRVQARAACSPAATIANMPQNVIAALLSSGPLPAGPVELVARLIAGLEAVPLS